MVCVSVCMRRSFDKKVCQMFTIMRKIKKIAAALQKTIMKFLKLMFIKIMQQNWKCLFYNNKK